MNHADAADVLFADPLQQEIWATLRALNDA